MSGVAARNSKVMGANGTGKKGRRSECGSMIMTVHHLFGKELAALTNGKI
jgi:hypothetical protein